MFFTKILFSSILPISAISGLAIYSKYKYKAKTTPIYLNELKQEVKENNNLKEFITGIIRGKEINDNDLQQTIESIKNSKIKHFLKKIFPKNVLTAIIPNIKQAFKTKSPELFHDAINSHLNKISGINHDDLKNFFEEILELIVSKKYSEISDDPLSKGLWFLVFPNQKSLIVNENDKCGIHGIHETLNQDCKIYDIDLDISKAQKAFKEFGDHYSKGSLDDQFKSLVPIVNKYISKNQDIWDAATRKTSNDEIDLIKLISWYEKSHLFVKENWNDIKKSNQLAYDAILEIEQNLNKLNNLSELPKKNLNSLLDWKKAYLLHFPKINTYQKNIGNYSQAVKNFYTSLTKISMTHKQGPLYLQTAQVSKGTTARFPSLPIHSIIFKAIKNDLDRVKKGDISVLLTFAILYYVEGFKKQPSTLLKSYTYHIPKNNSSGS